MSFWHTGLMRFFESNAVVKKIVEGLPLFSEKWLPDAEATDGPQNMMGKMMMYWHT